MVCPYCRGEMEAGGIFAVSYSLSWKPKPKKKFTWRGLIAGEDRHGEPVPLADAFLKGVSADAFCCRSCKKIIVDYGEQDSPAP